MGPICCPKIATTRCVITRGAQISKWRLSQLSHAFSGSWAFLPSFEMNIRKTFSTFFFVFLPPPDPHSHKSYFKATLQASLDHVKHESFKLAMGFRHLTSKAIWSLIRQTTSAAQQTKPATQWPAEAVRWGSLGNLLQLRATTHFSSNRNVHHRNSRANGSYLESIQLVWLLQTVQRLAMVWTVRGSHPTCSASSTMGTWSPWGGKAAEAWR